MSRAALVIRLSEVSSGRVWLNDVPTKSVTDKVFIRMMLAYSARKKRANGPPAYSTLKPETSSDSPSVRSKGARFVSARVDTYHMAARGSAGKISHVCSCAVLNVCRVKPPAKRIVLSKIRPKLTSYEIVWATARKAPIRAYFEFDAHPEPKMEYTVRLERARINRIPRFRSAMGNGIGRGAHRVSARVKAKIGVKRNKNGEAVDGRTGSFVKSFRPSANG